DGSLDPSIDFLLPSALPWSVLPAVGGRRAARGLAASVDVAAAGAPERHRALGSRGLGAHGGAGSRAPTSGRRTSHVRDLRLRGPLVRAGHRFHSETDTEVVAHLVEDCLARTPAGAEQFVGAVIAAFRRLDGLNAIAILDVHTGQLVAVKSGSPLVVGGGDGG